MFICICTYICTIPSQHVGENDLKILICSLQWYLYSSQEDCSWPKPRSANQRHRSRKERVSSNFLQRQKSLYPTTRASQAAVQFVWMTLKKLNNKKKQGKWYHQSLWVFSIQYIIFSPPVSFRRLDLVEFGFWSPHAGVVRQIRLHEVCELRVHVQRGGDLGDVWDVAVTALAALEPEAALCLA